MCQTVAAAIFASTGSVLLALCIHSIRVFCSSPSLAHVGVMKWHSMFCIYVVMLEYPTVGLQIVFKEITWLYHWLHRTILMLLSSDYAHTIVIHWSISSVSNLRNWQWEGTSYSVFSVRVMFCKCWFSTLIGAWHWSKSFQLCVCAVTHIHTDRSVML